MAGLNDLLKLVGKEAYDPRIANKNLKVERGLDYRDASVPDDFQSNTVAYAHRTDPNTVHINNPKKISPYVMAHEVEHTLGNRANLYSKPDNPVYKKYLEDLGVSPKEVENRNVIVTRDAMFLNNLANLKDGNVRNEAELLMQRATRPDVAKHISKTYGVDPVYLGNPKGQSLEELFADLSSIETLKKKDLTADKYIRKQVFNNDKDLIDSYKAVTGLRTTRLDAKDPEPFVVDKPSKFEKIKRTLGFKYGGKIEMPKQYRRGGRVSLI